jgi:bacteriorhodopsin
MNNQSPNIYLKIGQYNLVKSPAGDQIQLQIAKPQYRWIIYATAALFFVIYSLAPQDSIASQAAFLAFTISFVSAILYFAPNSKLTFSKRHFTLGRYGREIPYGEITDVHFQTFSAMTTVIIRTLDSNHKVATFFNKSDAEQLHSLIKSCQRGEGGLA